MECVYPSLLIFSYFHRNDKAEDKLVRKPVSLNGSPIPSLVGDAKSVSGNIGKLTDRQPSLAHPSSSLWNGDANSSTVNDLLKMSHQGFGNDRGNLIVMYWFLITFWNKLSHLETCSQLSNYICPVSSWNGDQSQVERTVEEERQASWKRSRDEYETELDRGKVSNEVVSFLSKC